MSESAGYEPFPDPKNTGGTDSERVIRDTMHRVRVCGGAPQEWPHRGRTTNFEERPESKWSGRAELANCGHVAVFTIGPREPQSQKDRENQVVACVVCDMATDWPRFKG